MLDFAQQQESARRRTRRLVVAFVVLSMLVAVLAAPVFFAMMLMICSMVLHVAAEVAGEPQWTQGRSVVESLFVADHWRLGTRQGIFSAFTSVMISLLIVGGAALSMRGRLREGRSVAHVLGGRLIQPNTLDAEERRLLNVVEEMSIASGVAPPPVYVMDREAGINAFAAGYLPEDAVLGFTRGALDGLTREQLQGVVAHEFSHVFNGDMRLNIRLISMLHGLMALQVLGAVMARMAGRGLEAMGNSGGGRNRGGPGAILIIWGALSLLLMAIGFLGHLAGAILRSMVSRQREYLADASAVQFTRNPEGIGGALRVLGGLGAGGKGGRLQSPTASEVSHMCFVGSSGAWLDRMLSSHPPLAERVRRVLPGWDGSWLSPVAEFRPVRSRAERRDPRLSRLDDGVGAVGVQVREAGAVLDRTRALPELTEGGLTVEDVLRRVAQAETLLEGLSSEVTSPAHDPYDARAVVLAVVYRHEVRRGMGEAMVEAVRIRMDESAANLMVRLGAEGGVIDRMEALAVLPLVQVCVGAMANLGREQVMGLVDTLGAVARSDWKVDLFEWAIERLTRTMLRQRMGPQGARREHPGMYLDARVPAAAAVGIVSTVANLSGEGEAERHAAFARGVSILRIDGQARVPAEDCQAPQLDVWVDALRLVNREGRMRVLRACAAAAGADGQARVREIEFVRVIAACLDVPLGLPLMERERGGGG